MDKTEKISKLTALEKDLSNEILDDLSMKMLYGGETRKDGCIIIKDCDVNIRIWLGCGEPAKDSTCPIVPAKDSSCPVIPVKDSVCGL